MVKFPPCRVFHADFMDYSAAVTVLDGCCLSDCQSMKIMTKREMGRATTIGSTAAYGGAIA